MSLKAVREQYGIPAARFGLAIKWYYRGRWVPEAQPRRILSAYDSTMGGLRIVLEGLVLGILAKKLEYLDPKTKLRIWPITPEQIAELGVPEELLRPVSVQK